MKTARGLKRVLTDWSGYCDACARRFATGYQDEDAMTSEAQEVVWQTYKEGWRGDDLARQIKVRVPRRLIDVRRDAIRQKRDARSTCSLENEMEISEEGDTLELQHEAFHTLPDVHVKIEFRESVARLLAMATEDERMLLDMYVNGSNDLSEMVLSRAGTVAAGWRIGVAVYAKVLHWSEKRVRRAREGLKAKAAMAFAA